MRELRRAWRHADSGRGRAGQSILRVISRGDGFQATVTGSGLEPDSSVDVFFTWGSASLFFGDVASGSGEVAFTASGVCVSLGSPLTDVAVAGTPVGGEQTEYPVPLPDAAICPPPT